MAVYIALDPGHGGKDPGAVGPDGIREADFNLAQALTIKHYLSALGYRVGLTRISDEYVGRWERIRRAKDMGAGLFISIHHDTPSATRPGVYYSRHPLSKGLAEVVQVALPGAWILPSSASRFDGLYIDNFPGPAILIEFGPTQPVSREERIARARAVVTPIVQWIRSAQV